MTVRSAAIDALLHKVGSDAEAATQLLVIAASFLETRTTMPDALAGHLAKTFKQVAALHRDERAKYLAQELGLSVGGAPRKAVAVSEVANLIATNEGMSETALKRRLAKSQGISTSTALKHIKAAKKAREVTKEFLAGVNGPLVGRNR